jgi:hypothetical protein
MGVWLERSVDVINNAMVLSDGAGVIVAYWRGWGEGDVRVAVQEGGFPTWCTRCNVLQADFFKRSPSHLT